MQLQKKLQNDAQIIEDSLFALRQPKLNLSKIAPINALNNSMEKAIDLMEERTSGKANDNSCMTSANNLAFTFRNS